MGSRCLTITVVLSLLAAFGCGSGGGGGSEDVLALPALVGPEGGTFLVTGSQARLQIPAGAFPVETMVIAEVVDSTILDDETTNVIGEAGYESAETINVQADNTPLLPIRIEDPTASANHSTILVKVVGAPAHATLVDLVSNGLSESMNALPGIAESGMYVILEATGVDEMPVLLTGTITDESGTPASDVIVSAITTTIPSVTAEDGSYTCLAGLVESDLPTQTTVVAEKIEPPADVPSVNTQADVEAATFPQITATSLIVMLPRPSPGMPMPQIMSPVILSPTQTYTLFDGGNTVAHQLRQTWEEHESALTNHLQNVLDALGSAIDSAVADHIANLSNLANSSLEVGESIELPCLPISVEIPIPSSTPNNLTLGALTLELATLNAFTLTIASPSIVAPAAIGTGAVLAIENDARGAEYPVTQFTATGPGAGNVVVSYEATSVGFGASWVAASVPSLGLGLPVYCPSSPSVPAVSVSLSGSQTVECVYPVVVTGPIEGIWVERWDSSTVGFYVPVHNTVPFQGDTGEWRLGDTVSSFSDCGPTPNFAEIFEEGSGNKVLRLQSFNTDSSCADNVFIGMLGLSIPLEPGLQIAFDETGALSDLQPTSSTSLFGDRISLALLTSSGDVLRYVMQWTPGLPDVPTTPGFEEIRLPAPAAGSTYVRDVFADFETVSTFPGGSGVVITEISFTIGDPGVATLDNLRFFMP